MESTSQAERSSRNAGSSSIIVPNAGVVAGRQREEFSRAERHTGKQDRQPDSDKQDFGVPFAATPQEHNHRGGDQASDGHRHRPQELLIPPNLVTGALGEAKDCSRPNTRARRIADSTTSVVDGALPRAWVSKTTPIASQAPNATSNRWGGPALNRCAPRRPESRGIPARLRPAHGMRSACRP